MRKFKRDDFEFVDSDLMVSEASYLGFPPGCVMREFEVEDFGVFTFDQIKGDTFVYLSKGYTFIIQIFND